MHRQLKRTLAAMAVAAVGIVGPAAAAGAISNTPPGEQDPPPTVPKANLQFSAASVTPAGSSQWAISYTVKNAGTANAGPFHIAVHQNGTVLLKDTYQGTLAAGAARSETIFTSQTSCYLPIRFAADTSNTVVESKETDNVRWAVGLTSTSCPALPRYTVKATSFTANDESGYDWAGSDEPYWTFNTVGTDGTDHATSSQVFGDVDTGESRTFGATEGCLYLSCAGGTAPFGIGFSAQLWEHDLGDTSETQPATVADYFKKAGGLADALNCPAWVGKALSYVGDGLNYIAGWGEDDLLGTNTSAFDPVYLASRLPAVGGSFTDSRIYSGASTSGGAVYTLNVQVTRVG